LAVPENNQYKECEMESIFGLLVLIADIYAIIKIIQSSADGLKKVLWILGVIIFPILGFIVWYFAGPGRK
jgi:hypothetical protein